eukprot:gb/GEZN01010690.1/.p1 GENE.gb/GEZN01010690.1/~~gb/GEZN01010690.1/.p1  ORF type:complete len:360 (+),score=30.00 gb/GEZN01010690.1/:47-1081(+)
MAAASGEGGATVEVHVHSLVVMSIADHYTLAKSQQGKDRVTGLLFGTQTDQIVTVFESFELADQTDAAIKNFETYDLPNFVKIYPDYECVGWYTTGTTASEDDAEFHSKVTKDIEGNEDDWRCERPLALYLHPDPSEDSKELPLYTYERVLVADNTGEGRSHHFTRCPCRLVSDEAERVTVVHCARTVTGDESEQSALVRPFQSASKAMENLNKRIRVILQFLQAVDEGKIKADQKVLRQIKTLCNRLPTMNSKSFKNDFFTEYNDAMLVAYLAAITKAQTDLTSLVSKHNIAGPKLDVIHAPGGNGGDIGSGGLGGEFGILDLGRSRGPMRPSRLRHLNAGQI